jgi:glycosyltransferase involved in cell wall biosynthesis
VAGASASSASADVAALMRAADLFVFLPLQPFGLVVLEAMASGLPVVTARATGAAGLVTADAGIVLADADDTAALSA